MSNLIERIKKSTSYQNASLAKDIRSNPELDLELKRKTSFLDSINPSTATRMYYVKHGLTEILRCKFCNNQISNVNNIFCSKRCAQLYFNKDQTYKDGKSKSIKLSYSKKTKIERELIKEHRKLTFLKKYGVSVNFLIPEVKEKISTTFLKKYGETVPSKSSKVKDKAKKTCLEKYGAVAASCTNEVKKKIMETTILRYGVDNTYMVKYKIYKFPSGKTIKVQGYENRAIDQLLFDNYSESDIFAGSDLLREIGYIRYEYLGKVHRYYPDIFIKSENKIIEVKSEYTFTRNYDKILQKMKSCVSRGFTYEFWVFGKKLKIITPTDYENFYSKEK